MLCKSFQYDLTIGKFYGHQGWEEKLIIKGRPRDIPRIESHQPKMYATATNLTGILWYKYYQAAKTIISASTSAVKAPAMIKPGLSWKKYHLDGIVSQKMAHLLLRENRKLWWYIEGGEGGLSNTIQGHSVTIRVRPSSAFYIVYQWLLYQVYFLV